MKLVTKLITGQVPTIDAPDLQTFQREYAAKNQPVILTGAIPTWEALGKWDLPFLRTALGKTPLRVYVSSDGAFRAHPELGFHESLWKTLTGADYIDWVANGPRPPHLLLQHQSLLTKFPQLGPDIRVPIYVDSARVRDVNLWIGAGDNVTPLHCDQADNLLIQIIGEKRLFLASPAQRTNLYPFGPLNRIPPITSRVNLGAPDLQQFPRLKKAKFFEATLRPGEMIFLPVHWWHEVHGMGTNVSVNFWWEASNRNVWRYPNYMLSIYAHNLWRVTRARLGRA
jgi:hypothetical protein